MKHTILIFVIFIWALASFAQDNFVNDPAINEDANACYPGGSMEGKCNIDFDSNGTVDQYETDWAWECGWYAIRFENGLYTANDIPAKCATTVGVPASYNNSNCYTNGNGSSLNYTGPANTKGNIIFFSNTSCDGEPYYNPNIFIVFANDGAEANALCAAQGTVVNVVPLRHLNYNTPNNFYGCVVN